MKKRIACLLLTLVMLVSLIPTAAITASAAGLRISEAGIKVIKDYMGFKKTAYQAGSEYRIGYGTPSVQGATITEANADQLLREALASVGSAIESYVPASLVQKRFDALVWYSYVYGTGWTSSSAFVNAVNNNVIGSEFADIMCTWDYDAAGFPDDAVARGVLVNRMAMANLYLNGVYSTANSGSFSYTVFDAGNGAYFATGAQKMVQVFDCNQITKINVLTPSFGLAQFLGWYSSSALVTGVGSATAGVTLTAGWQGSTVDKVAVSYTLPAYVIYEASGVSKNDYVIVRQEPNGASQQIDVIQRDALVSVAAEKMVGAEKWLQLTTGGWVKLCSSLSDVPTIVPSVTVTITDDYVNVREKPSVTAAKVGVARRGETRVIVMTVDADKWGYCSEGWIFLAYTNYNNKNAGSTTGSSTAAATPGTVSGATRVNVRTGAGVHNALATTLAEGTAVNVYEQVSVNGAPWGRIDQGWIALQYVTLKQAAVQTGSSATTGSTVYVSSSVNLNVRSGPGTEYSKVGSLVPGTAVVILQKQTVGGVSWALIDQGWINMNYVSGGNTSNGTSSSVSGIGGTVVNCATGVNIRSAAGTTNALVGTAALGSRVTVSERVEVNGHYWGHIERGWVCMDYIQLDQQWTNQVPTTNNNNATTLDNVITTYEGYPAVTTASVELRATASSDAKSLMTLNNGVSINILDRTIVGVKQFGKVTIGTTTGWVDMSQVQLQPINAKVTAAKADAYELPNVRSKFYASLVKDTYVTIGNADGSGWELADGTLWGQTKVTAMDGDHIAWIKLSDVTMFKGNETPNGVTTLNGVGYLTGSVTADSIIYEDFNGGVIDSAHSTPVPTKYTLTNGHRVNILARNYQDMGFGVYQTWAKVSVGSVTGWIDMTNVALDRVVQQATMDIKAYSDPSLIGSNVYTTIPAGSKVTIQTRTIIANSNEINHGITDCGYVFVDDNAAVNYWIVLDEGKLANVSAAPNVETGNPSVVSGVVVTIQAPAAGLNIYEETMDSSRVLLKQQGGSSISILNWKLVGTETWGKVQVGNIVGWIKVDSSINFSGLTGTVNVADLPLYTSADRDSSVQILRVQNVTVSFIPAANPAIVFDGTTLWGQVQIADRTGWVDMANLRLNTATAVYEAPESVIATGKINSVDASINIAAIPGGAPGSVTTLPKGTAVNLTKVQMAAGEAWWMIDLGTNDGWAKMDYLTLNSTIARITEASAPIYDDLTLADTLYTLYRGEAVTILSYKVASTGALFGEVAYGETTGWVEICDAASIMKVSLTPGSTGTTLGNTNNNQQQNTAPTTPTAPSNDPIPAQIVCANTVNVRSGAGVENPLVTTLRNGTAIRIYEQTTVLGKGWAHIDQGWVCMDYVQLGGATGGNAGNTGSNVGSGSAGNTTGTPSIMTTVPAGAIAVGYANEDVKIRSGSGLGYPEVATVKKGNSLVIYEKKLDGGMSWGRTDSGWVCISYMTITGIGATGSGNTGTIARCGFTANVRGSANSGSALMAKVMITSRVVVYETVPAGSEVWARTDLGWISMDYIVMDTEAAPVPTPTEAPAANENNTLTDNIISVG